MANTSFTLTPVDHTSDAGFRTWGAEFHAQLVAIGLTQTSDTGQINWTTVVRPGVGLAGGYEVWRFNDTLQSTTPVFIKLTFGTNGTANYPEIWIAIGNGSNGSGTLTGLTSSSCSCGYSTAPLSTTLTYFSRFVYNPTLGFFGFSWKQNLGVNLVAYQSAFVFRSCDSTGAATSTSVQLLTSDNTATSTGKYGVMQCLNYTTGLIYPPAVATQGQWWGCHVFAQTLSQSGVNVALDPVFFLSPVLGVTQCLARALLSEVGVNALITASLVGSTPHNYIAIGYPFSSAGTGAAGVETGYSQPGSVGVPVAVGLLMLWE